ncbi:MAG: iron ABC transporter permease [Barnesiella sp.]|nr:iron ABC transporter permease [Bacteroidales bacterium]MBD5248036.1 iron ABC transporter permease [Barnesiella sp.]
MKKSRSLIIFIALSLLTVLLLLLDLGAGSVTISIGDVADALTGNCDNPAIAKIVIDIRLIKGVVAILAGMALSVSGLQMQTLFRNPLAGPYVLGVSSGASLAVALFILGAPLTGGLSGTAASLGMTGAALIGSGAVLALVGIVGRRIKDIMVVLILGIMVSSGISAIVQILQYLSTDEALKSFVIWTMGSLGNVTSEQLPVLAGVVATGLLLAVATIKSLNLLLLGEEYAVTMGYDRRRSRTIVLISTTLLAGGVTAFCGPIGFVGLALPHVARVLFATSDHRVLLPGAALTGAVVMLGCDIVSKSFVIPVNAVTSLMGIPIVIWIVFRNRRISI